MSRVYQFAPKEYQIKSESIGFWSQELLWNGEPIVGGGGGVTTMLPIGGSGTNDGARIFGDTLRLAPCDASHGGVLAVGDQDISSGNKTFQNNVILRETADSGGVGVLYLGDCRLHIAGESGEAGNQNFYAGYNAGNVGNEGVNNIGIGPYALANLTTGSGNVVINPTDCEYAMTTGTNNVVLSTATQIPTTTGEGNVFIGYNAGSGVGATASSNILISNPGQPSWTETIAIGSQQENALYMGGIGLSQVPDNIDTEDQLLWATFPFPGQRYANIKSTNIADFFTAWGVTFTPPT